MSLPKKETIDNLIDKLSVLITAIESNAEWTPPTPERSLYFTWDFVNRSRFMLQEIDQIKAEKGEAAAASVYQDVAGRCHMTKMLLDDPGKMTMITGGKPTDYGADIKAKAGAAVDAAHAETG